MATSYQITEHKYDVVVVGKQSILWIENCFWSALPNQFLLGTSEVEVQVDMWPQSKPVKLVSQLPASK